MFKFIFQFATIVAWVLFAPKLELFSQSPTDALMMEKQQACILIDYNFSSFNHYWEGTLKRENQTIATVQRQSFLPMIAVGITNDLNFYAGAPYIKTNSTEPNGGKFNGAKGFQDLSLALKYRWLNKELGESRLSSFATISFSTPVTNYLSDYMPYSLGFGAPELSYRAILQYETANNWYVRGSGAYLWRGYTKAERDYYYNNGSHYTAWMDVPNAINAEAVIGKWLFDKSLQLEMSYWSLNTLSGDDIRAYNAPAPTNKVNMGRIGVFAHYFLQPVKGLGIIAYHNRVINGRNAAEMNTTGGGITYFFNYRKI